MYALQALIEQDSVNYTWQKYLADCIGILTTRMFRWSGADNFELPIFSDMIEPENKVKEMTAEEIKAHVLKRLSE